MAKKQNLNYERNPWKMVLYIVAVVALAACLVFLVYTRREQKKAYQEELLQLQSKETEYVRPIRETEMESESETGDAKGDRKAHDGKKDGGSDPRCKRGSDHRKRQKRQKPSPKRETETESEPSCFLQQRKMRMCCCSMPAERQASQAHGSRSSPKTATACLDSQLYRLCKRADPDLHKEKPPEAGGASEGIIYKCRAEV